jgi:hypothetical protein
MITDLTHLNYLIPLARTIAADWHSGQASPLYALSSSGTVLRGALDEVNECYAEARCDDQVERLNILRDVIRARLAHDQYGTLAPVAQAAVEDALLHEILLSVAGQSEIASDAVVSAIADAWQAGRAVERREVFTADQVAKKLGVTTGLVRRYAATRGVGRDLGRDWVFSRDDVEALRQRRRSRGRPREAKS